MKPYGKPKKLCTSKVNGHTSDCCRICSNIDWKISKKRERYDAIRNAINMKNSEVNKMKKAKEQSVRDEADCSAILQAMNEKNLAVEILWTAMKHCKSHPSHTIEEAIDAGFTAWVK